MRHTKPVNAAATLAFMSVLFGIAAGCSSTSSVSVDALPARYDEAFCDYFVHCPTFAGTAVLGIVALHPGTAGTCADLVAGTAPPSFAFVGAAVAAGTVTYDGAEAERCLATLENECMPLGQLLALAGSCSAAFSGTIALGGACQLDEECLGTARCQKTTPSACGGTCVALAGVGAACSTSRDCVHDRGGVTACRTTPENPTTHCVLTRWVEAPAGSACGETDADGDQRTSTYCTPDAYCQMADGETTGTCAFPLALGAACDVSRDACVRDAGCVADFGTTTSTCRSITVVNTANAPCDSSALVLCNPLDRLVCTTGVCVPIGAGTNGATCRSTFAIDCNDGLYCHNAGLGGTSTCLPRVADGGACVGTEDVACLSGYCDDVTVPATPVCATLQCAP